MGYFIVSISDMKSARNVIKDYSIENINILYIHKKVFISSSSLFEKGKRDNELKHVKCLRVAKSCEHQEEHSNGRIYEIFEILILEEEFFNM